MPLAFRPQPAFRDAIRRHPFEDRPKASVRDRDGVRAARRSGDRPETWRSRLPAVAAARPWYGNLDAESASRPAGGAGAGPLLYLLDRDRLGASGQLEIHFVRRSPDRVGSERAFRVAQLSPDDIRQAPTTRESALLAQLLQLVQAQAALGGYGQARPSGASGRVVLSSSVEIPVALADPLLAQLAATGRLALTAERDERGRAIDAPPCWIALDEGPPWQLRLELAGAGSATETGYELRGRFARGDETLGIERPSFVIPAGFLIHGATLARADVGGDIGPWRELRRETLRIPATQLDDAVARMAELSGLLPLDFGAGVPYRERSVAPLPRLRFAAIAPGDRDVRAQLDFRYGESWLPGEAATRYVSDAASRSLLRRDADAEAHALAALDALGFRSASEGEPSRAALHPTGTLRLATDGFETAAHDLLAKGWRLEVDDSPLRAPGRATARVRSGIDFFDLDGGVAFGDEVAPFPALLAAARDGARFVRLADGSRGLLPRAWLARSAPLAGGAEEEGGRLRFRVSQASLLAALLAGQDEVRADRRFSSMRRRLAAFSRVEPISEPAAFQGTLREYQRFGLGWLAFLERLGLGGCLADDMGLGKTVQVLAHLAARSALRNGTARGRARRPSLVVAPRSVLHGWIEEARRFLPSLRVLRYDGAGRAALRAGFRHVDLVVTTYGTLRQDIESLREHRFDYAILDEAQAIKSEESRTARAARRLRAEHRLAVTGTPIENHLGELASLMEFLNPGMLGRARSLTPLLTDIRAPEQLALLTRVLRPFLLRRTKSEVLRELPAKTEQTLFCDLLPAQRRQYDELRRHYQRVLSERFERVGIARSKIHVLEALLRLRQSACHPALIDRERAGEPSAKLEVLFEQLDEVLEEGHKALVFSQFTRLLALVREGVETRGIDHAYLDGRTRDRQARIERFQQDPACRLFLVSLKAGGTGLNLTAADYVFLLDPWWNPAVEAQAIDRAHRIGQPRPVFAYRLVARDTVEEKILALQQHKRTLAETVLGAGEQGLVGSLSVDDLRELLG